MKKRLILSNILIILLVISLLPAYSVNAATLKLSKKQLTLEEGKKETLKVIGTKETVTWSSSNKEVATVSKKGVVKGISVGNVKITAKVGKTKLVCEVEVQKVVKNEPNISVRLEDTGGSTSLAIISITNKGDLPFQVDYDGKVYNSGYENLTSYVSIVNIKAKEPEFLENVIIEAGETQTICYINENFKKFWIDKDTLFEFDFTYDGIEFIGYTAFSGYFDYKQGRLIE